MNTERVKSVDKDSFKAQFIEHAPVKIVDEVPAILDACVFDDGA